ncbi:hypothetical protein [Alkalihalobacillus sp. AL-G]|uniref:hypothetical protein n=1 Tax=Alkalihalobacillus sp. AL-G TaxID=2926399 RepID=UPI00272C5E84|nr:hypothetical protein [Alkalihalobacillus sp. AL-G]WLD93812.1 hypothetical protein MOJ78_02530 [Alkalihalobacillus sp. AL-G]
MFDPTIFENLKVAFENHIYDLDNLTGEIEITNRIDRLELAVMSREFILQFTLADHKEVEAEIVLQASLKDLSAEILEKPGDIPGCSLFVRFHKQVKDVSAQCKQIEGVLDDIWEQESPVQTLRFVYGQEKDNYMNEIEIKFNRKINEEQMGDIPHLVDHVIESLIELESI